MSPSGRTSGGSELHKDGEVPETGKGGLSFLLVLEVSDTSVQQSA